jgi:membrane-associated protein
VIIDLFLHLDHHLVELLARFGSWIYAILFLIIFAETGFVVTPFLPGDSLLFGAGALAAIDHSGTLRVGWVFLLLTVAAIAGNSLNYSIGRQIGQRAFSGQYRFFKLSHLTRTQQYFLRYGGLTVLLSRFMPIIRTFAPFVAGIGRMPYHRFQLFNAIGGATWVALFVFGGAAFGNLPWVQAHFSIVTLIVIAISLLPMLIVAIRARFGAAAPRA